MKQSVLLAFSGQWTGTDCAGAGFLTGRMKQVKNPVKIDPRDAQLPVD